MKRLLLILSFHSIAIINAFSQFSVSGVVISKEDKSTIPGATIQEKGVNNGTMTDINGRFELSVSSANSELIVKFIGLITEEVKINGQESVEIKMKSDCNKCWFDSKVLGLSFLTGAINGSYGGKIKINGPWVLGGVMKAQYVFQTNFKDIGFMKGRLELSHYISNCNFDIDFSYNFRELIKSDQNSHINTFESDINFRNQSFTIGYGNLGLKDSIEQINSAGITIGYQRNFNVFLHPSINFKTSVFNNKEEYIATLNFSYKRLNGFIQYYNVAPFQELTFGMGYELYYRIRKS